MHLVLERLQVHKFDLSFLAALLFEFLSFDDSFSRAYEDKNKSIYAVCGSFIAESFSLLPLLFPLYNHLL